MVPPLSRYSATQSFLRGGDAERAALEAEKARIPGAADDAVELGPPGPDGNPSFVHFRLEIIEVQEEVYPGEFVTFWVYAPVGRTAGSPARVPSPTLRVQQGERVRVTLYNTHYLPHTIHFHGLTQSYDMDGVPDMPRPEIMPGESFTYEFTPKYAGTYFYHCHVHEHVHVPMGLAGMVIVEPRRPDNHFARARSRRRPHRRRSARPRARPIRANTRSSSWMSTTGCIAFPPPTGTRARSRSGCTATTIRRSASRTSSC